jgi:hypothetical protein
MPRSEYINAWHSLQTKTLLVPVKLLYSNPDVRCQQIAEKSDAYNGYTAEPASCLKCLEYTVIIDDTTARQ